MRRTVRRAAQPHEVWNAFIDLLATEDYESLSESQRPAHLAFQYDSEVQNGGHAQYFDTYGLERAAQTIAALRVLGLSCQATVLERACEGEKRVPGGELLDADAEYHQCQPTVIAALEECLAQRRDEFIALEGAG